MSTRLMRTLTITTMAAAALFGAATQASAVEVAGGPYHKIHVYRTLAECGRVGHDLVNHDKYADYDCNKELAGWGLWVKDN